MNPVAPRSERVSQASRAYVLSLLISVLIGMMLRWRLVMHYIRDMYAKNFVLDGLRDCLMTSFGILLVAFLWLFLCRYLPRISLGREAPRRLIATMGTLSIAQLLINLISLNLAIYRLDLDSYGLLLESMIQYVSLNMNFLFWYWFFDYPLRYAPAYDAVYDAASSQSGQPLSQSGQPLLPQGIMFPEEVIEDEKYQSTNWLPGPVDYFYFTILSSNCFGPPEGHQLIGSRLKALHLVHTLAMIFLLIVIVARAINTLG